MGKRNKSERPPLTIPPQDGARVEVAVTMGVEQVGKLKEIDDRANALVAEAHARITALTKEMNDLNKKKNKHLRADSDIEQSGEGEKKARIREIKQQIEELNKSIQELKRVQAQQRAVVARFTTESPHEVSAHTEATVVAPATSAPEISILPATEQVVEAETLPIVPAASMAVEAGETIEMIAEPESPAEEEERQSFEVSTAEKTRFPDSTITYRTGDYVGLPTTPYEMVQLVGVPRPLADKHAMEFTYRRANGEVKTVTFDKPLEKISGHEIINMYRTGDVVFLPTQMGARLEVATLVEPPSFEMKPGTTEPIYTFAVKQADGTILKRRVSQPLERIVPGSRHETYAGMADFKEGDRVEITVDGERRVVTLHEPPRLDYDDHGALRVAVVYKIAGGLSLAQNYSETVPRSLVEPVARGSSADSAQPLPEQQALSSEQNEAYPPLRLGLESFSYAFGQQVIFDAGGEWRTGTVQAEPRLVKDGTRVELTVLDNRTNELVQLELAKPLHVFEPLPTKKFTVQGITYSVERGYIDVDGSVKYELVSNRNEVLPGVHIDVIRALQETEKKREDMVQRIATIEQRVATLSTQKAREMMVALHRVRRSLALVEGRFGDTEQWASFGEHIPSLRATVRELFRDMEVALATLDRDMAAHDVELKRYVQARNRRENFYELQRVLSAADISLADISVDSDKRFNEVLKNYQSQNRDAQNALREAERHFATLEGRHKEDVARLVAKMREQLALSEGYMQKLATWGSATHDQEVLTGIETTLSQQYESIGWLSRQLQRMINPDMPRLSADESNSFLGEAGRTIGKISTDIAAVGRLIAEKSGGSDGARARNARIESFVDRIRANPRLTLLVAEFDKRLADPTTASQWGDNSSLRMRDILSHIAWEWKNEQVDIPRLTAENEKKELLTTAKKLATRLDALKRAGSDRYDRLHTQFVAWDTAVQTTSERTEKLPLHILKLWQEAGHLEIAIMEAERGARRGKEGVETRRSHTLDLSVQMVFELLKTRKTGMEALIKRLYAGPFVLENAPEGVEPMLQYRAVKRALVYPEITSALQNLFDDASAPPLPPIMQKLRSMGISDWASFKQLWREGYAHDVARMLAEQVANDIRNRAISTPVAVAEAPDKKQTFFSKIGGFSAGPDRFVSEKTDEERMQQAATDLMTAELKPENGAYTFDVYAADIARSIRKVTIERTIRSMMNQSEWRAYSEEQRTARLAAIMGVRPEHVAKALERRTLSSGNVDVVLSPAIDRVIDAEMARRFGAVKRSSGDEDTVVPAERLAREFGAEQFNAKSVEIQNFFGQVSDNLEKLRTVRMQTPSSWIDAPVTKNLVQVLRECMPQLQGSSGDAVFDELIRSSRFRAVSSELRDEINSELTQYESAIQTREETNKTIKTTEALARIEGEGNKRIEGLEPKARRMVHALRTSKAMRDAMSRALRGIMSVSKRT